MDSQPVSVTPNLIVPSKNFIERLSDKFRNLNSKKKILLGVVVLALIGVIWWVSFQGKRGASEVIIAKVGDTSIPGSYLEIELKHYPATHSAQATKMLTEKIVEDEIILKAGKAQGLINETYDLKSAKTDEYLKRTKAVEEVKNKVALEAKGITVEIVSVWFFNNFSAGAQGYAKGKQIAFEKISKLYPRVKTGEITMEEAGKIIASDPDIAKLDRAYKENSFTRIKAEKGKQMTFWPDFDAQLWQLEKGGLTQVYTGNDTDAKGKIVPILYAFGQVSEKVVESNIENFDTWFENNKKLYEITYY